MATTRRRGHGEGSVYQRSSDGLWIAAVTLPGGKRKTLSARTQAEAIKRRDKVKADLARGVLPDNASLSEWLDHWLSVVVPGTLKETTIDRHRSYIETWIKPTIGKVPLQQVTPDHVRLMMRTMEKHVSKRTGEKLSPRTVIKARSVLQAALSEAERSGKVAYNAAKRTQPPKLKAAPTWESLTQDEARAVIDAATDPRERARLVVALMAGLRQGEALALRWDHVTLTDTSGLIEVVEAATRVRKKGMHTDTPKSLRSERTVPLGPAATSILRVWQEASGGMGYVFPHRFQPDRIEDSRRDYAEWQAALKRAGVRAAPLHGARGTAESLMASAMPDWVAAEVMGHEVTTARRHYVRSTLEQRMEATRAVETLARG